MYAMVNCAAQRFDVYADNFVGRMRFGVVVDAAAGARGSRR